MFWDKGYTPSQNIEALLQKEDVTVEEFLDEDDLLQECKTQKRNLVQYLTRPDVIKRLIEFITTEPPEDLPLAQRFKHANAACEVLTFGLPSLNERLVEDPAILKTLYSYLEHEPPLNPLLSSFFCKTFSMLIWKKYDQDWFLYQKMCLQVLEFIKAQGNFLDLIFKHFATPVIMDLLLQIIKEVQGGALKKNLYEWLAEQQLVERLIYMLGQSDEEDKHNNIAEFLCELIKHGRSMRQTDQDNDCLEPSFTGSNPLLLSIENENAVSNLLDVMLKPNVKESTITDGISIVLTLVDESIVDEPASDKALQMILDKEKENHEKIVSTVIKVTAPRVKDFHDLILNPPNNTKEIITAVGKLSPPFGFTRLQICRLFTVLLKTGNKDIIEKFCEIDYFSTLLKLFKQYVWNNFLHSEVEKCLHYVFTTFDQTTSTENNEKTPSALQTFVIVNSKIIPQLIDLWMHNVEMQSNTSGRRLGYMGHLINILKSVRYSILESNQVGALINSNLNEKEQEDWDLIIDKNGELIKELTSQCRNLANCSAYESAEYSVNLPKEFNNENFAEFSVSDTGFDLMEGLDVEGLFDFDIGDLVNAIGSLYTNNTKENQGNGNVKEPFETPSTFQMDNFADFDAHFGSFSNDLGDDKFIVEKSDNNANVEKFSFDNNSQTEEELTLKNAKNRENDCNFDFANSSNTDPWQINNVTNDECFFDDVKHAQFDLGWDLDSGDNDNNEEQEQQQKNTNDEMHNSHFDDENDDTITKVSNGPVGEPNENRESSQLFMESSKNCVLPSVSGDSFIESNISTKIDNTAVECEQLKSKADVIDQEIASSLKETTAAATIPSTSTVPTIATVTPTIVKNGPV